LLDEIATAKLRKCTAKMYCYFADITVSNQRPANFC